MPFDISLKDIVIPILTFIAGTIMPAVYSKLTHEGIAIKQPFEFRGVSKNNDIPGVINFHTLLKFANVTLSSILVDEMRLNPSNINGVQFRLGRVAFQEVTRGELVHIPLINNPNVSETSLNYLPFIVESNKEKTISIEFQLNYDQKASSTAYELLAAYLENPGLRVDIRIDGKYRPYLLFVR